MFEDAREPAEVGPNGRRKRRYSVLQLLQWVDHGVDGRHRTVVQLRRRGPTPVEGRRDMAGTRVVPNSTEWPLGSVSLEVEEWAVARFRGLFGEEDRPVFVEVHWVVNCHEDADLVVGIAVR